MKAWVIEIRIDGMTWQRMGRFYRERKTATPWIPFIKAARHARYARTVLVEIPEGKNRETSL